MSKFNVTTSGTKRVQSAITSVPTRVGRAVVNAANRTATSLRKEIINQMAAAVQIKRRSALKLRVKRATSSAPYIRITAAAQSTDISAWTYSYELAGRDPTRGQIVVPWFGGRKISPGWIDPTWKRPKPVRTRDAKGRKIKEPLPAYGLTTAAIYKQLLLRRGSGLMKFAEATLERNISTDLGRVRPT